MPRSFSGLRVHKDGWQLVTSLTGTNHFSLMNDVCATQSYGGQFVAIKRPHLIIKAFLIKLWPAYEISIPCWFFLVCFHFIALADFLWPVVRHNASCFSPWMIGVIHGFKQLVFLCLSIFTIVLLGEVLWIGKALLRGVFRQRCGYCGSISSPNKELEISSWLAKTRM